MGDEWSVMDNRSNEIWKNWTNYNNWELRKHRFTEEMRPVFYKYLGITPDSYVLDGGCGSGVFTRYIASGLTGGKIKGFDIGKAMVDYGNDMIASEDLVSKCELVVADGLELPFENNTFDAVTNYTYLGVLSDPVSGLKELFRVCKDSGIVSAVIASNSFPRISWKGDYPFEYNNRLEELYTRQEDIYLRCIHNPASLYQSEEWTSLRYPKMFELCGLKDIHIYPFAVGFSYNDTRWPLEYRKQQVVTGIGDHKKWVTERSQIKEFKKHGFTQEDFSELIELLKKKQEYLIDNIETDRSFEWEAGLNIIVTGVK